nr:hypothetical protein [Xenorhabdus bovienii]
MQHIDMSILMVDKIVELFDFGCFFTVNPLLFLILGAVVVASE